MRVIKLGGSLMTDPALLKHGLSVLANTTGVVVPGGGRFADQVRVEQPYWGFSDVSAHDMAIMAMHQFGRLLLDLQPKLACCHTIEDLNSKAQAAMTVWLPDYRELQNTELEADWSVSSDSIALWLAQYLSAQEVVLVKSASVDPEASLEQMQHDGLLDAGFQALAVKGKVKIKVISKNGFDEYFAA